MIAVCFSHRSLKKHPHGLKGDFLDTCKSGWKMSEKLYSSRMSSSVTSCHLMTRARIHWPHIQWVVAVHTHMGIDCSCSLCKPWSSGTSVSPCAAELLGVVNIHEQSCTQPYLLNSFVHGNPQLQHPAAAIQLSNW